MHFTFHMRQIPQEFTPSDFKACQLQQLFWLVVGVASEEVSSLVSFTLVFFLGLELPFDR